MPSEVADLEFFNSPNVYFCDFQFEKSECSCLSLKNAVILQYVINAFEVEVFVVLVSLLFISFLHSYKNPIFVFQHPVPTKLSCMGSYLLFSSNAAILVLNGRLPGGLKTVFHGPILRGMMWSSKWFQSATSRLFVKALQEVLCLVHRPQLPTA